MDYEQYKLFIKKLNKAGYIDRKSLLEHAHYGKPLQETMDSFNPSDLKSDDYVEASTGAYLELRCRKDGVNVSYVSGGLEHNKGNGTRALNALCKLADEFGVNLFLETHDPDSELETLLRLYKFYKRFGFITDIEEYKHWDIEISSEDDLTEVNHYEGVPMIRIAKS